MVRVEPCYREQQDPAVGSELPPEMICLIHLILVEHKCFQRSSLNLKLANWKRCLLCPVTLSHSTCTSIAKESAYKELLGFCFWLFDLIFHWLYLLAFWLGVLLALRFCYDMICIVSLIWCDFIQSWIFYAIMDTNLTSDWCESNAPVQWHERCCVIFLIRRACTTYITPPAKI